MGRRGRRQRGPQPGPVIGARIDISSVGVYGQAGVEEDYLVTYTVSNPEDVDDTTATLAIYQDGQEVGSDKVAIGPFTPFEGGGTIQYRFLQGSQGTGYTFQVTGNAPKSGPWLWPYETEVVDELDRGYADYETAPAGTYDLMIFTGQSNMVGRGTAAGTTSYPPVGMAYTLNYGETNTRPMTNAFKHFEVEAEGSMITPFVASYIAETGRKVIAVPCGKDAQFVAAWKDGQPLNGAAKTAIANAKVFCDSNNINVGSITFHWNQGERDGKNVGSAEQYIQEFMEGWNNILDFSAFTRDQYDYFFIHRVGCGYYPTDETGKWVGYLNVLRAQSAITANARFSDFYKVGYLQLASMKFENGYMLSDATHFNDAGLEKWGTEAGKIVADAMTKDIFVDSLKASNDDYSLEVLGTDVDADEIVHLAVNTSTDQLLASVGVKNPEVVNVDGASTSVTAPIQYDEFSLLQTKGIFVAIAFSSSVQNEGSVKSPASNNTWDAIRFNGVDNSVTIRFTSDDGAEGDNISNSTGAQGRAAWNSSDNKTVWNAFNYTNSNMTQPPGYTTSRDFFKLPLVSNATNITNGLGQQNSIYGNVRIFNGYIDPTVAILSLPSTLIN